jgi:hypothetical protein
MTDATDTDLSHEATASDSSNSEKTHLPGAALMKRIRDQLTARQDWEERMAIYEEMIEDGLERSQKPHAGAADLHFPLIDMILTKIQPIYVQAVFGGDQVANFIPPNIAAKDKADAAKDYFDYLMRHESNWEDELPYAAYAIEFGGRCVIKHYWDHDKKAPMFEAVPATHIIIPDVKDMEQAEWIVHVRQLGRMDFIADDRYDPANKDKDLVKRLCGKHKANDDALNTEEEEERQERAGITYMDDEHSLVLWEVYQRNGAGKWTMRTVSPVCEKEKIRDVVELDEDGLPFVSIAAEKRVKGWYSTRGAAARIAPFEVWACKNWNAKADILDYTTKPVFMPQDGRIDNQDNYTFDPGVLLPTPIVPLRMPDPPKDLQDEIQQARMIAEQVVGSPDHAIGDGKGKARTAFEISKVDQLNQMTTGYRINLFLRGIQDLYRKVWDSVVLHSQETVTYARPDPDAGLQEWKPDEHRGMKYKIFPAGMGQQWDRNQRVQEAAWTYDRMIQNPAVDRDELTSWMLETVDTQLKKRVFVGTGVAEQREAQAAILDLIIMREGVDSPIQEGSDHAIRLKAIVKKLMRDTQQGVQYAPDAMQIIGKHIQTRMQALEKSNQQAAQEIQQMIQQLTQPQGQPQGQPMQPPPGAGMQPPPMQAPSPGPDMMNAGPMTQPQAPMRPM